jgi:GNAT superfamily N-acetyltransferase
MNHPSLPLTSRTGFRFRVRTALPVDDGTVADFFTHVTRKDLRFRFLSAVNTVATAQIAALTHVDHRWSENFLAFTHDGSMMIATAMLACDPTFEHGEVAIVVREDFKRNGIGWEMLAHVARFADLKGVGILQAIESCDNHDALEVERDMGFTVEPYPGDTTLMLVTRKLDRDGLPAALVAEAVA